MSLATLERPHQLDSRMKIFDCDIHPSMKSMMDYMPFLSSRWKQHLATIGSTSREPLTDTLAYPRMANEISRADAWPPNGGTPGSDLTFMQEQHLDPMGVETGVLIPLRSRAADQRNLEFGAALATAANDWQLSEWTEKDHRLRGSIVVAHDFPEAAVAEIERCARNKSFVQVLVPPRTIEPLGRRRYWPIFEAAARNDLPIALHIGGTSGHPTTSTGWVSYYFEEHHSNIQSIETLVTSLVVEGVFEHFPTLRILLIESGFAWVPALCWRLDAQWRKLKSEVPHLTKAPSEYVKQNIWYTTQPIDEPERPRDLAKIIDLIGWDRILFATDYPHWDFDDPRYALKFGPTDAQRKRILVDNAKDFYGLG
jgi:predicted TIM-barrel fold metal-dependent hydrolase